MTRHSQTLASANDPTEPMPTVFIGTGGYSDTDMIGTLYPTGTRQSDYLSVYANHYGAVEINSSFYAPIGHKAFQGMLRKSEARIKFAIKLHKDFSHSRTATVDNAISFINALQPIIDADCLATLFIQFPHGFDRTVANRWYLKQLVDWFSDYPLAIEFRHASWHIAKVEHSFERLGLIWCSVDYPKVKGLPNSRLLFTMNNKKSVTTMGERRIGYLRMHGNNLNWWDAMSASQRHDYRYSVDEMVAWAQAIANQKQNFDELYIFFQNTTNGYAYDNIRMLKDALKPFGFQIK